MLSTLLSLSVLLWFITACVFLVMYFIMKDKMFARFSAAFFLIMIGRIIFNFLPDVPLEVKQNIVIFIRAVASYLLIVAALNGHRKNTHTDRWLVVFLVVSVVTQWVSGASYMPESAAMGPIPFAISVGWFFAGWKFLMDTPEPYACCSAYKILGVVFLLKGIISVLGSLAWVPQSWLLWLSIVDLVVLATLLLGGILLSFQRHRVNMECDRVPMIRYH